MYIDEHRSIFYISKLVKSTRPGFHEYTLEFHCVKSIEIRSFFWSAFSRSTPYLSVFSSNAGKHGPDKTPYFDTFHAEFAPYPTDKSLCMVYTDQFVFR